MAADFHTAQEDAIIERSEMSIVMRYTADMLQRIEPFEAIRKRPDLFLPHGRIDGVNLCYSLLNGILHWPGAQMAILREDGWWIVASNQDWLKLAKGPESKEEYFSNILPFPEAGQNYFHGEVVVRALSDRLFFAERAQPPTVVVGEIDGEEMRGLLDKVTEWFPSWQFVVCFHLEQH